MASDQKTAHLDLGTSHFKEANQEIRHALEDADLLELSNVFAQRYIGCAMPEGKKLEIYGTPGNDMACYMDGGQIEVFGNAQDQIGNTMNGGLVVVHGRCGDAAGYAMRGGEIFIRDDCGWRVGINMKEYEDKHPTIVIGGDAGSFLGEYMAGGTIVLMGHAGEYLATGMHGGQIYVRHQPEDSQLSEGLAVESLTSEDIADLNRLLNRYKAYFEKDGISEVADASSFLKVVPLSSRPYASLYAN